jgi:hypothetical protein
MPVTKNRHPIPGEKLMKRTLLVLLIVFGTFTALPAQDAIDVKGAWSMTIETPQGPMPLTLTFSKVEGEDIAGTLGSSQGDIAVTGKLTAADIKFAGSFEANGRTLTLTFTGKIEKGAMSGQVDFGGMGGGGWSAKRAG